MKNDKRFLERKYTPYPIYQKVKDYYLFYFPESSKPLYYSSKEIEKLSTLICNKKNHPYYTKWQNLLLEIKKTHPDFNLYDFESNRPSYTAKLVFSLEEHIQIQLFFSISLIGPFYTLFIEEKKKDETCLYMSPCGVHKALFRDLESKIEAFFSDYIFICGNLLSSNFFNLVVPGLNKSRIEDGLADQRLTILQGLFFDYDLHQDGFFSRRGDKTYKTPDHYFQRIDLDEIEKRRETLTDNKVTFKEVL